MSEGLRQRDSIARHAVRVTNALSRTMWRGAGTVIGGRVGLLLSPDLLRGLSRDREVVLVSGTNGKTTTTAMIALGWGGEVTTNETGSNMPQGHVAALAASDSGPAVLEVDESWLPDVVDATAPRVVTLLNLSRDQLDRANEVRRLAERWRLLFSRDSPTTVVANANDPLVVFAAQLAPRVAWCDVPTPWTTDAVSCPACTRAVRFDDTSWWCECGFAKPSVVTTTLGGDLVVGGESLVLDLAVPGAFNESNAAMALTTLSCVGVDLMVATSRINTLSAVAGRYGHRLWRGRHLQLFLAKNPAGFAAVLPTVAHNDGELWLAINARLADGRDPSWLYDVPFELLAGRRVHCLGDRRLDVATRLMYAGVDAVVVDNDAALLTTTEPVTVLANYTAFEEWRGRTRPC